MFVDGEMPVFCSHQGHQPHYQRHGPPELVFAPPPLEKHGTLSADTPAVWRRHKDGAEKFGHLGMIFCCYPLVMTNIAIENGHRNSGFSH